LLVLLDHAASAAVEVFPAPTDYVVSQHTVLQPDLLVARRSDLSEANLQRTPLLVVEVQSPSTVRVDRGTKRLAFEAAGVPSYWIVDPDAPSLTVLELAGGAYRETAHVVADEAFAATKPFAVTVVPAALVR
jgi:Uma2 family endonuclease